MSFALCLNTSTIRPVPLLQKIHLTAKAGYAGIELWINDLYEHVGRGGEVRDVERALADTGLFVPCLIALRGWGDALEADYPAALDECRRRMELAARLRSPFIIATPPRLECDLNHLARCYQDLLAIGRQAGVKPTCEYLSIFRSAWKLEHAWQIVQASGDPDATLALDAFHSWNSCSNRALLREIPAGRISHYHINDAARGKPPLTQTDADRVLPGDGCIDLQAELQILRDKGYTGAISLELFNEELWAKNPTEVLKLGLDRMRELLG